MKSQTFDVALRRGRCRSTQRRGVANGEKYEPRRGLSESGCRGTHRGGGVSEGSGWKMSFINKFVCVPTGRPLFSPYAFCTDKVRSSDGGASIRCAIAICAVSGIARALHAVVEICLTFARTRWTGEKGRGLAAGASSFCTCRNEFCRHGALFARRAGDGGCGGRVSSKVWRNHDK